MGDTLAGDGPEGTAELQNIGLYQRFHRVIRRSGGKDKVRGLDGRIAMINCKRHIHHPYTGIYPYSQRE